MLRIAPEDPPVKSQIAPEDPPVKSQITPEDPPVKSQIAPEDPPVQSQIAPEDPPVQSQLNPDAPEFDFTGVSGETQFGSESYVQRAGVVRLSLLPAGEPGSADTRVCCLHL